MQEATPSNVKDLETLKKLAIHIDVTLIWKSYCIHSKIAADGTAAEREHDEVLISGKEKTLVKSYSPPNVSVNFLFANTGF